jgi:alkylhydroperoxidase family enzyme
MQSDTMAADLTLVQRLRPAAVDLSRLRHEHGSMLQIVRLLIGVVPNCDSYLAIWPTGFRTYNLLVPNLLNLPFSVWGFGPSAVTLGLALCAASRTAQCSYCTAHTCSFTLRRGASPEKLAGVLPPAEKAAVAVAEALASIPCVFTREHREEIGRHFSAPDAERIALGVALMGFLNKFMDALAIDLEEAAVEEASAALAPTGWTPGKHRVATPALEPELRARPGGRDTLVTKLAILRHLPGAIRLDLAWTRGVPSQWPAVGAYLKARTGHDFPLLAKMKSRRAVRAIATVLRDNLDASDSRLGLSVKALAGLVYATIVGSGTLAREARGLALRSDPSIGEATLDAVVRFASSPADAEPLSGLSCDTVLALLLAKAVSPSPATVPAPLVERVSKALSPQAQIELVVWIAVQQMLHRLGSYLDAELDT